MLFHHDDGPQQNIQFELPGTDVAVVVFGLSTAAPTLTKLEGSDDKSSVV